MSKDKDLFPRPNSQMCLWYYRGDLGHAPRVAIITSFGDRTGLNLTIFEDGKRETTIVSGVRHKDDPFLLAHPTHKIECGCWDYLIGQDPRETPAVEESVTSIDGIEPHRSGPGRPRINPEV